MNRSTIRPATSWYCTPDFNLGVVGQPIGWPFALGSTGMKRIVLTAVVALALAACGGGNDSDEARTLPEPEPTTTAEEPDETTTTTTTEPEPDWLAMAREAVEGSGVQVEEVTVRSGVMRIHTDLGYAPDDEVRRGMAAQVCFDVQAATEWEDHIEVHAGHTGILAWTGASNEGCRGFT